MRESQSKVNQLLHRLVFNLVNARRSHDWELAQSALIKGIQLLETVQSILPSIPALIKEIGPTDPAGDAGELNRALVSLTAIVLAGILNDPAFTAWLNSAGTLDYGAMGGV